MRAPLVAPAALAALREHARSVPDGHEVAGLLRFTPGRGGFSLVWGYRRMENLCADAGRVRFATTRIRGPEGPAIPVHSHPSGPLRPSAGDLRGCPTHWLSPRLYGVYAVVDDALGFFEISRCRTRWRAVGRDGPKPWVPASYV